MKQFFAICLLIASLIGIGLSAAAYSPRANASTFAEFFHCHHHDIDSDPAPQPLANQEPMSREMDTTLLIVGLGAAVSSAAGFCAGIAKGYRRHHRHYRHHK